MNFIVEYSMPILAALLLALFFLFLPELSRCQLFSPEEDPHRLSPRDCILMALITVIYALVAFHNLGNTQSPESFENMENRSAVIGYEGDCASLMFFTGIGIGQYNIEYSPDGLSYSPASSYSQSHADVLKWQSLEFSTPIPSGYLRISGSGNVWLGEVVLLDTMGSPLSYHADSPSLSDEGHLMPEAQTFMNSTYFDEIYHARTAWEHLEGVYPYEITHPPLGKIIISLGIALFGMTPFGWRFSGTFLGVLMLPIIYVFLKKLFGGKATPAAGTILFASDFMHFVQTRISTIDTYAVFFILLMYLFMYLFFSTNKWKFLAFSGIFFGFGAASKWTCLYAGAGLALIWLWYWIRNRNLGFKIFLKNSAFSVTFFVIIPCLIYYFSYIPHFQAHDNLSLFSKESLKIVLDNQSYMFNYHSDIVATHPYSSRWYQWLLDIRPILYYLQYLPNDMRSSFGAFVNPILCWAGFISLFVLLYCAIARKDSRAAFILIGYLAQLLPWVLVSRLTFAYHYFPCTVFLVLALGYVFHLMETNSPKRPLPVYLFSALSVAVFILFYPALSGKAVNNTLATRLLGWLPSWPF